jgi:hypothetical protein
MIFSNPQFEKLKERKESTTVKNDSSVSAKELFRPLKDVHIIKVNNEANFKLSSTVTLYYRYEKNQGE